MNRIPIQIEKAAGATGGSSRAPWLGYIASGATHLAGGLLLGSVWGTALVQLVPPPNGTNSIELTVIQMAAVDASAADDAFDQATPVMMASREAADEAAGNFPPGEREIRPDRGEMPPASLAVEPRALADAVSAAELERSTPDASTPRKQRLPETPPAIEPPETPVLEKSAPPQPRVRPDTAADLAVASTRQQGQDAESSPQKVHSPPPAYPAAALRQGITGRVVLRVRIDAEGAVVAAGVLASSGHAILDEAALAAVRQWRFQPARHLGVAIEKAIAVPLTFRIDRGR